MDLSPPLHRCREVVDEIRDLEQRARFHPPGLPRRSEIPRHRGHVKTLSQPQADLASRLPCEGPKGQFNRGRGWNDAKEKPSVILTYTSTEDPDPEAFKAWRAQQYERLTAWADAINKEIREHDALCSEMVPSAVAKRLDQLANAEAFEAGLDRSRLVSVSDTPDIGGDSA